MSGIDPGSGAIQSQEITAQSSTAILGVSGVFTGSEYTPAFGYHSLCLSVFSDQNSASSGIRIDWFIDSAGATLVKTSLYTYNNAPLFGQHIRMPVQGAYFRIQYTNTTIAQTRFTLSVFLSTASQGGDAAALSQLSSVGHVAPIVRMWPTGRINESRSRTYIKRFIENVALGAGTTIYTVTATRTFYLTGVVVMAVNTANATGVFVLQDGVDVTDRIPFVCPNQPIGGQSGWAQISWNQEFNPIPFTTDVRAIGVAGTIAASITINGYEEG